MSAHGAESDTVSSMASASSTGRARCGQQRHANSVNVMASASSAGRTRCGQRPSALRLLPPTLDAHSAGSDSVGVKAQHWARYNAKFIYFNISGRLFGTKMHAAWNVPSRRCYHTRAPPHSVAHACIQPPPLPLPPDCATHARPLLPAALASCHMGFY